MSAHLKISITKAIIGWAQNRSQVPQTHPGAFAVSLLNALENNAGHKISDLHLKIDTTGACYIQTRFNGDMEKNQHIFDFENKDVGCKIQEMTYILYLETFAKGQHSKLPEKNGDTPFFNGHFVLPKNRFSIRFQFSRFQEGSAIAIFRYLYD
jgi:hypothetical protein